MLTTPPPYATVVTGLPPLLATGLAEALTRRSLSVSSKPLDDSVEETEVERQAGLRRGYVGQVNRLSAPLGDVHGETGRRLGYRSVDEAMCNTGAHGGGLVGPEASPFFVHVGNAGGSVVGHPVVDEDTDEDLSSEGDDEMGSPEGPLQDEELPDPRLSNASVFAETFRFSCHKRYLEWMHSAIVDGGLSDKLSIGSVAVRRVAEWLDGSPSSQLVDALTAAPIWPYPPSGTTVEEHGDKELLFGPDVAPFDTSRKMSVSFAASEGGGRIPRSHKEVAGVLTQSFLQPPAPHHDTPTGPTPNTFTEAVAFTLKSLSASLGAKGRKRATNPQPTSFHTQRLSTALFRSPEHQLLRYCRPPQRLLHAARVFERQGRSGAGGRTAEVCEAALSERYLSSLDNGIAAEGGVKGQRTPPFEALARCLFRIMEQDLLEHGDGGMPFFKLVSALSTPNPVDGTVHNIKVFEVQDLVSLALTPIVLAEQKRRGLEERRGELDARRQRAVETARLAGAVQSYVAAFIPPNGAGEESDSLTHAQARKRDLEAAFRTEDWCPLRFGPPSYPSQRPRTEVTDSAPQPIVSPQIALAEFAQSTVPMTALFAPSGMLVVVDVRRPPTDSASRGDLLLHRTAFLAPPDAIDDFMLSMCHNPHLTFGGEPATPHPSGDAVVPVSPRGIPPQSAYSFGPSEVPIVSLHHGVVDTATFDEKLIEGKRDGTIQCMLEALRRVCEIPRALGPAPEVDTTAGQEASLVAHLQQVGASPAVCADILAVRRWVEFEHNDSLIREASGEAPRRATTRSLPVSRSDIAKLTPLALLRYIEQCVDEHQYRRLHEGSIRAAPPLPNNPGSGTLTRSTSSLRQQAPHHSSPTDTTPPSFLQLLSSSILPSSPTSLVGECMSVVSSGTFVAAQLLPPSLTPPQQLETPTKQGQPRFLRHLSAAAAPRLSRLESNSPWHIKVLLRRRPQHAPSSLPSLTLPADGLEALRGYARSLVAAREAADIAQRKGELPPPSPPDREVPSLGHPPASSHTFYLALEASFGRHPPTVVELPIVGRPKSLDM